MKKVLVLKNEISELSKLVTFIENIGDEMGLSSALVMSLNLALEEAVSNIILYAYPKKFDQDISIEASKENNALIFTITDTGVEFDPTKAGDMDITLTVEDRPIGGLGIFLIKKIMNEIEYQRVDDMNVLILKKLLE